MTKKIVITCDVASGDKAVTDESGNRLPTKGFPLNGADLGEITSLETITVMATHNSPGCRWVLVDGQWHWLCD